MMRIDVTNVIQTKSGRRRMLMPGARSVRMVAITLIADATEPTPRTSNATIQ